MHEHVDMNKMRLSIDIFASENKQLKSEKEILQAKIKKLQRALAKLPLLEHEVGELRTSLKQSMDFTSIK